MIRNVLASLFILIMGMQVCVAQGLSAGDMVFAFRETLQEWHTRAAARRVGSPSSWRC